MATPNVTGTFLFSVWMILVGWRIGTTLLPLPGYIHPDEFFQAPEIMAGDVFDLSVRRTWEFNATNPIRSIAFPFFTCGIPFRILKYLSDISLPGIGNVVNPYTLLVAPRIGLVAMSLFMDFFIFRSCRNFLVPAMPAMLMFASSYILLTFLNRPFSNTSEAFLLSALLYIVSRHVKHADDSAREVTEKKQTSKGKPVKNEKGDIPASKKDQKNLGKASHDHKVCDGSCRGAFWISTVLVAGVFNRPTFPAFAVVPYLGWLLSDADFDYKLIVRRLFACLFWSAVGALTFILIDSFYYHSLDFNAVADHLSTLNIPFDQLQLAVTSGSFLKNLTVTPLNFLSYNLDSHNLEKHGSHPKYTHLMANLPMLFGPIATIILLDFIKLPVKTFFKDKISGDKHTMMLFLTISVPLLTLSIFPHQEARFLIPLLVPVAILYAPYIFGNHFYKSLCLIWFVFNFLAFLFYGVLHQGGMYSCTNYLQHKLVQDRSQGLVHHIVFYHTYMPPHHLFTINENRYVGYENQSEGHLPKQQVFVHDLAGASEHIFEEYMKALNATLKDASKSEIYVVTPATMDYIFCRWHNRKIFKLVEAFSPHLSTEDPPDYDKDFRCRLGNVVLENCNRDCRKKTYSERLISVLSLHLYKANYTPERPMSSIPE